MDDHLTKVQGGEKRSEEGEAPLDNKAVRSDTQQQLLHRSCRDSCCADDGSEVAYRCDTNSSIILGSKLGQQK